MAIGALILKSGKWVGAVNELLSTNSSLLQSIFQELRTMHQDMGIMRHDVQKISLSLHANTVADDSPLGLTDLGEYIATALDAERWAEETAVHPRVDGKHPYDIQEDCFDFVYREYQPDQALDTAIKEVAYEKGHRPDSRSQRLGCGAPRRTTEPGGTSEFLTRTTVLQKAA